jgi:integrase
MLTEAQIRKAKHGPKARKLSDMRGLFLLVAKANSEGYGSKLWRFRYKASGADTMIALGSYPEVSLDEARDRLAAERKRLAAGVDLAAVRREARGQRKGGTFREVAEDWMSKHFGKWATDAKGQRARTATSENYLKKIRGRMMNHIFPEIGAQPMGAISAKDILGALQKMEAKGLGDGPLKAKNEIGQIFNYAVMNELGGAKFNPVPTLKGALKKYVKGQYPGLTQPKEVGQLLRDIDGYQRGRPETRLCMKLMSYLWQRPTELRRAEWREFDLENARWTIPAPVMKIKDRPAHVVPLPRQALALLKELHTYSGDQRYLFPGIGSRERPISENTVNQALRNLGYDTQTEHCGHGFRTTASTLIEEELAAEGEVDLIFAKEAHLAHGKGASRGPYARGQMLKRREDLLQRYADYLDKLRTLPLASHGRSAKTAAMKSSMSDSSQRIA